MRYVAGRGAQGVNLSQAAYLYGSSLQNTGAGPFTIPTPDSYGPFPQAWAYTGSAAVVLNLPSLTAFSAVKAFVFVIRNDGTGSASIDVRDPAASTVVTLAIGESAFVVWDSALLTYYLVGLWQTAGAGAVAIPQAHRLVTNANAVVTFADGSVTMAHSDSTPRTITMPLITGADVGRIIVLANRTIGGSGVNDTVSGSGGQGVVGFASGNLVQPSSCNYYLAAEVVAATTFLWIKQF